MVVAVNLGPGFDDEDVEGALYGSRAVQFRVDEPGWSREVRQLDGAWVNERGPSGQRVSAVLTVAGLSMANAVAVPPQLWLNRWANVPLEANWPFTTWSCTEAGVVSREVAAPDMAQLLRGALTL